ncbi:hypothetical protein G8770_01740 [Aestuariicella hydrocarbonica]|uniref:Mannosyl-glycoprotein endo-beta-N-acetylglucosamidase-like domain-containing protein n=1 Tax=Pseudomaricurvus hydrocarbonicus TaxID=1470433 RepID=A0A9E5MJN7_9GAMM|nr:glucosaminidase domain-containing protein [Aestuariicella hydrocarbonica]NHO64267.1 hypothetical protein [Aestuariicella hydrocarbonica]
MKNSCNSPQAPLLGYLLLLYSGFCLFLTYSLSNWQHPQTVISETSDHTVQMPSNATEPKKRFYARLLPPIQRENANLLKRRQQLLILARQVLEGNTLNAKQQATLASWAKQYRSPTELNDRQLVQDLLQRIDVVPASMALAQSAMESAWGRSRFAREANNYFGQWCYTKGCGVIPNQRTKGARHEVARFASLDEAVAAYMHNINSHPAYAGVRNIRARSRRQNQPLDSLSMTSELDQYSERGQAYIKDLQGLIRYNQLSVFDQQYPTEVITFNSAADS